VSLTVSLALAKHPEAQAVIDAWPSLPAAVRAGILAMVAASGAADKRPT
jgi:hypothetical protein